MKVCWYALEYCEDGCFACCGGDAEYAVCWCGCEGEVIVVHITGLGVGPCVGGRETAAQVRVESCLVCYTNGLECFRVNLFVAEVVCFGVEGFDMRACPCAICLLAVIFHPGHVDGERHTGIAERWTSLWRLVRALDFVIQVLARVSISDSAKAEGFPQAACFAHVLDAVIGREAGVV